MRPLLFLAHRIPYPPDKGDKIRSYHILRHLARRFEIHLGCFADECTDERYIAPLRDLCADVFCLPLGQGRVAATGLKALVSRRSISETFYYNGRMVKWVSDVVKDRQIGDIFVFCSAMAPYALPHRSGRRLIIDAVDVDSEKWDAYARSSSAVLRPLFRLERDRVLALEKRAGEGSDHILFVSRAEAETFATLAPELSARIGWLNNGVDSEYFDPGREHLNPFDQAAMPIVFTGAMDYRANIEAVTWFSQNCFPQIRQRHPRAQFWIVGAKPSPATCRLAEQDGVRVTGRVADVRPFLAHAACAVAPLLIARGVQNKVLEAMAMRRPVVVTPEAREGVDAQHGQELLVASRGDAFVECVSEVLSGRWSRLGYAAQQFAKRHHAWPENLKVLDGLFPDGEDEVSTRLRHVGLLPAETG